MIVRYARGVTRGVAEKIVPEDVAREMELELVHLSRERPLDEKSVHSPDAFLRALAKHAVGRARRRRTLIDQLAAGDDLDALSTDLAALDADLVPFPPPRSATGAAARAALEKLKGALAPRDALVAALLFEDGDSMENVADTLAMRMEDLATARERILAGAPTAGIGQDALPTLGDKADSLERADDGEDKHAEEPVLALLRNGDHGDDLADAIVHVARCPECRARLVAGEVVRREVVVVAIEAPRTSVPSIAKAAEQSQARFIERGHGRFTAVVDAARAEQLKSELEKKDEPSVVSRFVMSAPLEVPRADLTSGGGRHPMPSMLDFAPKEAGIHAAEIQAWAQMRRVPKQKVARGGAGWALFAIVAVMGAIAIAYWLAIR